MKDFSGVEDTLFIPLVGRIYSSKHFQEFFYDEKALELEKYIPSAMIEENTGEYFIMAAIARYHELDKLVTKFIKKHHDCNIISLGAGLETMYFRLNNKEATFYEIDMPDVIKQRELVLGHSKNEILIGSNILDYSWMEKIDKSKPTLALASGVFQYFHEEEVLSLINALKENFNSCELVFDATNKIGIKKAVDYVKKTGNSDAMMYFYVQDALEFTNISHTTLLGELPFYKDSSRILKKKLKLSTRITCYFGDKLGFTKLIYLKVK